MGDNNVRLAAFPGPRVIDVNIDGEMRKSYAASHVQFEKATLTLTDGSATKEVATLIMFGSESDKGNHHFFERQDLLVLSAKMKEIADSIVEQDVVH